METSIPKDLFGQEIKVGSIIAYANIAGRSANQCVYVVTKVFSVEQLSWGHSETVWKLNALPLIRSYDPKRNLATLAMLECCVVLPDSYRSLIP